MAYLDSAMLLPTTTPRQNHVTSSPLYVTSPGDGALRRERRHSDACHRQDDVTREQVRCAHQQVNARQLDVVRHNLRIDIRDISRYSALFINLAVRYDTIW